MSSRTCLPSRKIAQSVADLLRLHLPEAQGRERPSAPDVDAYTKYLRARFLIHQQSPEALYAALEELGGSRRPIPAMLSLTAEWLQQTAFCPNSVWSQGPMCIQK